MKKNITLFVLLLCSISGNTKLKSSNNWGFYAHQLINRHAVFLLQPPLFSFYKKHIQYITENAVKPDQRRYAVDHEAPRHYIDLDVYGDSAAFKLPRYWKQAVDSLSEDTLMAYGIVPWHINFVSYQLTNAFKEGDSRKVLSLSADLGHYIADANVPLHTTENYNGQLTNQYGIHGFWESRLPELYASEYNFFIGKAEYINNTQLAAWDAVINAHACLDSVLNFEKKLNTKFREDEKYAYEIRGQSNTKVYSREFSEAYHELLDGQVERQMRKSIKMIADFWYTCWINAGQPTLKTLEMESINETDTIKTKHKKSSTKFRNHESSVEH